MELAFYGAIVAKELTTSGGSSEESYTCIDGLGDTLDPDSSQRQRTVGRVRPMIHRVSPALSLSGRAGGFSFVEVLIALPIIIISVVALLNFLTTSLRVNDTSSKIAEISSSAPESLKSEI